MMLHTREFLFSGSKKKLHRGHFEITFVKIFSGLLIIVV